MNDTIDTLARLAAELTATERALLLDALGASDTRSPSTEDHELAIVGIGCRLPARISSPRELWTLLEAGHDAVTEIPAQRWDAEAHYSPKPDQPGRSITRYGAFVADLEAFDPHVFDVSELEASRMDPQQRMLLEVCHEALEDAGIAPEGLRGTKVGVFVGACGHDFEALHDRPADVHTLTGMLSSVLAGRVSHSFGFEGPSLTVDTACSSSLVALHLARESLLRGESELALVAGVNAMLSPAGYDRLSRMRALSPDGRCRTFDVGASGYARGEGVGVVVLSRLAEARRRCDRIWARVSGSAINHDGRSAGLTAPSGAQQRAVIEAALASAGLDSSALGYIEAHGTGTPLGDPIEIEALREVLGEREHPCVIGSIKTNLGHLEGAAGVVGLIKVALAMHHERIPRHLHFDRLNPRIDLGGVLEVSSQARAWPRGPKARVAGVSSFGISGTNVHAIVREAPERALEPARVQTSERTVVLPLAARDHEALTELARRYAAQLSELPHGELHHFAAATATRRAQTGLRLAVIANDPQALAAALTRATILEPGPCPRVVMLRDPSFDEALIQRWTSWGIATAAELELGDHSVLSTALEQLRAHDSSPLLLLAIGGLAPSSLDEYGQLLHCPDLDALHEALAELHRRGLNIDWSAVYPGPVAHVSLPRYPWQHRRFPLEAGPESSPGVAADPRRGHPCFGEPSTVATAPTLRIWQATLDATADLRLGELRVAGVPVATPALIVDAALSAAVALGRPPALAELRFDAPLELDRPRRVQLIVDVERGSLELFACDLDAARAPDSGWVRHAHARLATVASPGAVPNRRAAFMERGDKAQTFDLDALYAAVAQAGVEHGPRMRGIRALEQRSDERVALLAPSAEAPSLAARRQLDPIQLDACLQLLTLGLEPDLPGRARLLSIEHIELTPSSSSSSSSSSSQSSASAAWAQIEETGDQVHAQLHISDDAGAVLATLRGCVAEPRAQRRAPQVHMDAAQMQALALQATREILGLDPKLEIPLDQDLTELGMDSLLSFELADRLSELLGMRLDDSFAVDYPSLGRMLAALLEGDADPGDR